MKLSGQKEWLVIGALIVYISFFPPFEPIRQALKTPVGKAAMLAAIVYTWKYWSPLVAVLFAINYLRCAGGGTIWEGYSGAEATCTCAGAGFSFDSTTKTCKDATGKVGEAKTCTCSSGYAWDSVKKECVVNSGTQPPVPPLEGVPIPAPPTTATDYAIAYSLNAPKTNNAPITTPGAAQDAAKNTPPATESFGGMGPVPMLEAFKTQYSAL